MKKLIEKQTGISKIKRRISGFWRRIIAFVVDGIILTTFAKGLSSLFGSIFAQRDVSGLLVGFGVFILYFGVLNSFIGDGQTMGKRLLQIRVVNVRGRTISFTRAVLRAGILGSFFLLAAIPSLVVYENMMLISSLVAMIIGTGIIYFYVFNRTTRQSLHDLISGSFVVDEDAEDVAVRFVIERKHYLVYSLLVLIVVLGGMYLNSMEFDNLAMNTEFLQNRLKNIAEVTDVSLRSR